MNYHSSHCIGILVANLGTPNSFHVKDVRKYLKEFLFDQRIVEIPKPILWILLNVIILNIRPRKSAIAYKKVWTKEGSPLLSISRRQVQAMKKKLSKLNIEIVLAMRYGTPSIKHGLEQLQLKGASKILILPLYPQYSSTTTASIFDAVADVLKNWKRLPELRFVNHYHDYPAYISALNNSVRRYWNSHGRADKLLMSFHGIPQKYFESGDPYFYECNKTAELLAKSLKLRDYEWLISFQSRFGPNKWLSPYTDHTLRDLALSGTKSVEVICPGFSADCLETMEEISIENRDLFIKLGGTNYRYIPCLNDDPDHISMIDQLVNQHINGWECSQSTNFG